MTDEKKSTEERLTEFRRRFNKWIEYDGWNTLTGMNNLKDFCYDNNMTREEAEALSKNLSIADVFREGLAELLNEDDEGMDEGEMAFRFSGEEDDKWIDWFSKERELRD